MTVVKWVFTDETESPALTSTFTLNPSEVSVTKGGSVTNPIMSTGGRRIVQKGRMNADTMQISGTFFEEADYDSFVTLADKMFQLKLTDDLNRDLWVLIESFKPTRAPTRYGGLVGATLALLPWRMTYSINMTKLDWSENEIF